MFFLFSPRLLSRLEAQRKAPLLYIGGLSSPFDVKVDNWDSCFIKGKMLFLNCCPHLFSPAVPANILTLSYLGGQRKNSGQLHILYIDPWWGSPHTCHYFTFVHFLPLPSQPSTKGVQKFHIMFTPGLAILNKRREHCMQLHSRVLHENTCFGNSRCAKWILGPWVNRINIAKGTTDPGYDCFDQ